VTSTIAKTIRFVIARLLINRNHQQKSPSNSNAGPLQLIPRMVQRVVRNANACLKLLLCQRSLLSLLPHLNLLRAKHARQQSRGNRPANPRLLPGLHHQNSNRWSLLHARTRHHAIRKTLRRVHPSQSLRQVFCKIGERLRILVFRQIPILKLIHESTPS
jgi:hypothetical protein